MNLDRRGFLDRAAKFAVGGMTAATLLDAIHYAENDDRVNSVWPAYEAALKASNVPYTMHQYAGTQHGFNNDTTPRYDRAAATLAWQRTLDFLNKNLRAAG